MSDNPYASPQSNLYLPSESGRSGHSVLRTLLVSIIGVGALWVLLFIVAPTVAELFAEMLLIEAYVSSLVIDAVISFAFMCLVFYLMYTIPKTNAVVATFLSAATLFLYWGLESRFFINGFNPLYPLWYEINMGLNDFVAALMIYFVQARRRK